MIARLRGHGFRWLLIGLIAALVADPATLTAFADDDGEDFDDDDAAWSDDDGDDDDLDDDFFDVAVDDEWDDDDNGDDNEDRQPNHNDGIRARQEQSPRLSAQSEDDDDDDDDDDGDGDGDDDDDACEFEEDDDDIDEIDGFCNDQAIVRLNAGADINAVNADFATETIDTISGQRVYLLRLPNGSAESQFAQQLEADSENRVAWAELNFVDQAPEGRPRRFFLRGDTVPRAGSLDQAYAPVLIGAPEATCVTGNGVIVAVIDSGLDPDHPAFANTDIREAWNAFSAQAGEGNVDDIGNSEDDDRDSFIDEMTGHGTHVAGIVTQIAPGATIMPIKALDSDGMGQAFYLARAIYRALEQNADVINLSLGSTAETRVVREATDDAVNSGIFAVAAAGNSGETQPQEYPATQAGVFGVAATDSQDRRTEFTSIHGDLDISAPGADIVSAFPLDQPPSNKLGSPYALWSGTSMATPWVSGAAALLLERNPGWDAGQIATRLQETAGPINGSAQGMGSGRLDAGAAVGCEPRAQAGDDAQKDNQDKNKNKNKNKKRKNRR